MNIIYRPGGEAAEYAFLGLNHYIGCAHGCTYCYMRDMDRRFGTLDFDNPRAKADVLELLERDCQKLQGTDQRVHVSFATDPYQPLDGQVKLTRDVLQMLQYYSIPFQILTKAGRSAARDFDVYRNCDLFGVTLTTLDPAMVAAYEPRAAVPIERMVALQMAKEAQIKTWVSLEPVLNEEEAIRIIERTCGFVDLYKVGALNHRKNPGIAWRKFAPKVVEVLKACGAKYYLKSSLSRYLEPGQYENTDWRVI